MINKTNIIFMSLVVIIVFALIGGVVMSRRNLLKRETTAPGTTVATVQTTPAKTSLNADQQTEQDVAALDDQLKALDTESISLDQSLNDQMVNLSR